MNYLISFIACGVAVVLFVLASWAAYNAFTESWIWALVALPIYASSLVAGAITTAGFSSAGKY